MHAHKYLFLIICCLIEKLQVLSSGESGFRVVSPTYRLYKSGSDPLCLHFHAWKASTFITASSEEAAMVCRWCFSNSKGKNIRWL